MIENSDFIAFKNAMQQQYTDGTSYLNRREFKSEIKRIDKMARKTPQYVRATVDQYILALILSASRSALPHIDSVSRQGLGKDFGVQPEDVDVYQLAYLLKGEVPIAMVEDAGVADYESYLGKRGLWPLTELILGLGDSFPGTLRAMLSNA